MDIPPREIELKFTLDLSRADEILNWLGQGRPQTNTRLTSIYFDTPRGLLRQAGLSLRVRNAGGHWIQTIKTRVASGGRLGRDEWEWETTGAEPDLAAARRTPVSAALERDGPLSPLFAVEVVRQAVDIRLPDSHIEACLDRGAITARGDRTPIGEIELELKRGEPAALFDLARRLQEAHPVRLSGITKADRGLAVCDGGGVGPRKFQPPALSSAMTAGEAFRAMARAALDQMVWNAEVLRETPQAEAIHQVRVGVRRLRATLRAFRTIAVDARHGELMARLKAIAGDLDPARNLDVFIDGAWARASHVAPQSHGDGPEAQRQVAYVRAGAAVESAAFGLLALDLMAWIEAGPWTLPGAAGAKDRDRPVKRFAATTLDRLEKRLWRSGRRLRPLEAEARHEIRIRAKGLRYAADIFDQLFEDHPKRARHYLAATEDLLENLGGLNDIETARRLTPRFSDDPDILAGEIRREATLLARAEQAFHALRRAKLFWR